MNRRIALLVVAALSMAGAASASAQSSANYRMVQFTLDAGVGDMASANYRTSSSLGQGYNAGTTASANFTLASGFWHRLAAGLPPLFSGAKSRKVHGSAGTFDLALSLVSTSPTIESRAGPAQTIVMTFDKPIASANAPTVSEGAAAFSSMSIAGNDVIMNFTGVTNPQYVTFNLANVTAADGGTGGTGSVRVGFLFGDVNQSRQVTVADVGIVNSVLLQAVTATTFLRDVNVDGKLTVADKGLTNANLLQKLPLP
ncbi:MAG TPA: hypothetical protein PLW68_11695 [Casimicrobiaceae bacterium]|nr:hypothetical protein [Casimicrobiaceae bacterium]